MYLNAFKLQRATQWAKEQGKAGDQDVIKARYIALGGALEESAEIVAEPKTETAVEPKIEEPKVVERVVRRGRRSSK